MRKRLLLVSGFVALMGLILVSRGDACVRCKIDLVCTKYGQDCTYQEYCAAGASPRSGATFCYYDSLGTCYEGDSCFWASSRRSFDPATALRDLLGLTRGCTPFEVRIG